MNKEILEIKTYFYDIVEFKNDPRTYKRYESGYWVEVYNHKEFYMRNSEELEEAYEEFKSVKASIKIHADEGGRLSINAIDLFDGDLIEVLKDSIIYKKIKERNEKTN